MRARRGSNLVEVMAGTVLLAIAATGAIKLWAVAAQDAAPAERADGCLAAAQSLGDSLRNYVTADASDASAGPGGSWHLPGDACGGCSTSCHALEPGCAHDVSSWLGELQASKRLCQGLTYTVRPADPLDPGGATEVDIRVTWTPPSDLAPPGRS